MTRHFSRITALLILLFATGLLVGCDGGSAPASGGGGAASGGSSGLARYADNLCALLPEATVRAEIPEMPAEVEHKTGARALQFCSYTWPGPRKGVTRAGGREIEYPLDDSVTLMWVRAAKGKDPLAWFRNAYRTPTAEETAEMQERMRKAMEKKVAEGKIPESAGNLGSKIGVDAVSGIQFERVDGVGTAAAWGGSGSSRGLKVLDGDWEFDISVSVYEDDAKNREASVRLAGKILAAVR